MAKVAEYKKKIVQDLVESARKHSIIGLVNLTDLPAPQLQSMRKEMKGRVEFFMTKKRLMNIAFDMLKEEKKGIENLKSHFEGMPALLLTNESPFKLSRLLQKSKTSAPAKPGQIAPQDIVIPKGPTPFAPGPIISELSSIGLKVGVEAGKIAIKEDTVVAKKGEKINQKTAEVLARLDVRPMQVGLGLVAAYENGVIYQRDVLEVDEKQFADKLSLAAQQAFNLAFNITYTIKDNISLLIAKAFRDAKAIGISQKIFDEGIIEELLGAAERQMSGLKSAANIAVEERPRESPKEDKKGANQENPKEEKKESLAKHPKEDETDKKVREMVEKTKKFAEGKEETAADLLKQVEKENPQ